jgi:hypothetical protein
VCSPLHGCDWKINHEAPGVRGVISALAQTRQEGCRARPWRVHSKSGAVQLLSAEVRQLLTGRTSVRSYSERKFSSTLHYPSTPQAWEPLLVKSPFLLLYIELVGCLLKLEHGLFSETGTNCQFLCQSTFKAATSFLSVPQGRALTTKSR